MEELVMAGKSSAYNNGRKSRSYSSKGKNRSTSRSSAGSKNRAYSSRNSGKVVPYSRGKNAAHQTGKNLPSAARRNSPAVPQTRRSTDGYSARYSGTAAGAVTRQAADRDYSLIFIVAFFLIFGLVMLYSTSSYEAGIDFGDTAYYLKRQLAATVAGVAAMAFVAFFPIRYWKKYCGLLYAFSAVMLLLIIPFGRTVNGAKRWIYIGPVSVQPAEISKIAVIVLNAVLLSRVSRDFLQSWRKSFLLLVPTFLQVGMIYGITRNMSSAIIVAAIALCMLFVATEDYKRYWLLFFIVVAGGTLWIYLAMQDGSVGSFRSSRIRYWLDPQAYAESGALQTLQGLYGIGSGGIFGKGLGQSMQKLGYIPEAQNDMIFSIICEELGLFGAISIIAMFIILCWRLMVVAIHAQDLFSSLLVVGVMAQIAVQVVLNIAVVTNTIPNTGVTLPFFSYGGSAIVIQLVEIGLVLNVARNGTR